MMDHEKSNVEVIHCPFAALTVQPLSQGQTRPCAPYPLVTSPVASKHPVGARGIRGAVAAVSSADTSPKAASSLSTNSADASYFVSSHRGGQLLLWNSETYELVASYSHGTNVNVIETIVTPLHIITRVECIEKDDVMEEFLGISVLSRDTLEIQFHLNGHAGHITAVAVHPTKPTIIVTAGLDYSICMWDLSQPKPLSPFYRTDTRLQGIVSLLAFRGDYLVGAGGNVPISVWRISGTTVKHLFCSEPDKDASATALLVAEASGKKPMRVWVGSTNGYVREWHVAVDKEPVTIEAGVHNKLHRASVSIIARDAEADIMFSVSTFDGLVVYNHNTGASFLDTHAGGIASLVVDPANKLVLVGNDKGTLCVLRYAEFAANSSREVTVVWRSVPHKAAISSILLETTAGSMWERLITSSTDSTFTVMDYAGHKRTTTAQHSSPTQDPELFMSVTEPSPSLAVVGFRNKLETSFLDLVSMREVTVGMKKPTIACSTSVTAVCWDAVSKSVIVGTEDGKLFSYTFSEAEGSWLVYCTSTFLKYQPLSISASTDGIVWLALKSKIKVKNVSGGVAGVRLCAGNSPLVISDVNNTVPIKVVDCSEPSGKGAHHHVVVLHNDRSIVIFTAEVQADKSLKVHPLMDVCAAHPGAPGTKGAPSMCVWKETGKLHVVWPDGFVVNRSNGAWTKTGISLQSQPPLSVQGAPPHSIRSVHRIGQAMVDLAIQYDSTSGMYLLNDKGDVFYHVEYDGSVVRKDIDPGRRQSMLSFSGMPGGEPTEECVALGSCLESRYLVFAYSNGLLQVLDTSSVYICARFWLPQGTSARKLWCRSDRIIVYTTAATFISFPVRRRILLDVKE